MTSLRPTLAASPQRSILVVVLALLAFSPATAAEPPSNQSPGKKLYETKCIRCHEHHDITVYEDMTWKRLLFKMKNKARLDDEEYGDLSDYLKEVRKGGRPQR